MMNGRDMLRFVAAPLASVLLLCGVGYSLQMRQPPPDVVAYHDHVLETALGVPTLIGQWLGKDEPVPAPARDMLRPNVMICRKYQNIQTGESVTMMIVQVRDAWNMAFHYPPVCYKFAGWKQDAAERREWQAADMPVAAMEYSFKQERFDGETRMNVANFMILPTGLGLDDKDVRRISDDPAKRFYGAGQVQIVFDSRMTPERRQVVFSELVEACLPLVRAVVNGEKNG